MRIDSVAPTRGGAQAASGVWGVEEPVPGALRPVYRRTFWLRLSTGGMAGRAVLRTKGSRLEGAFRSRDHTPAPAPLTTSLANDTLGVTLPTPQRLLSATLTAAKATEGHALELYRMDGSVRAPEPTDTGTSGETLTRELFDLRFALRVRSSGGGYHPLAPADLAGLRLRGYPTGARLGLATADAPDEVLFFWRLLGEVGRGTPPLPGEFEAGEALAAALQRHLDGLPAPLPETVEVALVAESDAPCTLQLARLRVRYSLVRASFADPAEEKRVLRFGGAAGEVREVRMELPARARVRAARVEVVESFRGDRPSTPGGGPPERAALAEGRGAALEAGVSVAQRSVPGAPLLATGISLGLLVLAGDTELRVEVREECQGGPSGRVLAAGTVALERTGERRWVPVALDPAVVLPPAPCWVVVSAARGRAVWLAAPDPASAPVRRVASPARENPLPGLRALHHFLVREGDAAAQRPPLALAVGSHRVPPAPPPEEGPRVLDLTAALSAYLAGAGPAAGPHSIPLAFTAGVPGIVTVYPPTVTYDVP